jgi:hypothetical protein
LPKISENFIDILENYEEERKNPKVDSEFSLKIEEDYAEDLDFFVKSVVSEPDKYSVSINSGDDKWLNAPFANIFNEDAGESYRSGLFVGYSFFPKKKLMYVKLDQGCKGLGGNFDLLFIRGEKLRSVLYDVPEEFQFDPSKCAAGNVIGKNYKIEDISEEILEEDLKYLIETYEMLMPFYKEIIQLSADELVESLKN